MATAPDIRLDLRPMTADDLPAAQALSKGERWPHRVEDWQMMLSVGEGAVVEAEGTIVGTIMWFPTGNDSATIGMVIVSPDHRGRGIGRMLMDHAIEAVDCGRLLLNGTAVAVPMYRTLGFEEIGRIAQHQGTSFQIPLAAPAPGERLRPIGDSDYVRIQAMVEDGTGLPRKATMNAVLDAAQVVVLDRDGDLVGVACFRRFGRGYSIGPVIAPSLREAKLLISHWLGSRAGDFTRIDVLADSGLSPWLDELGLLQVDGVVTMRRGDPLPQPVGVARPFAILSQALG
ncbi:GNAT family N-acetyltransferase [Sphingomonas sp. Leaf11]|nr:GNAT family N-acetyltransferase [Sphingomonas sp. Leaf11]KQM27048.1 hypothetical protein ASE58_08645 [Sphingomonas sp. Leaf9]KQM43382.1 hypothetical protein ASE57_08640 [Sphingomonas sp. Leaf11]